MNVLYIIMLIFASIGAVDRLIGNKIGLGKEFEKGIMLLGQIVLAMFGMLILAPAIADFMSPIFGFTYNTLGLEPSIVPAMFLANDMGGAAIAREVAQNEILGNFNGMVVAAMFGVNVSFTIPWAIGCLKKEKQSNFMLGLMCGIITIPVGCFFGGLICGIPVLDLLLDLLPLVVVAVIIAIGLWLIPKISIKIFTYLGYFIKVLIVFGFIVGAIDLLLGVKVIEGTEDIHYVTNLCVTIAVVLSGAFPLLLIISKLIKKPLNAFGNRLQINQNSTLGFISSLASNVPTFNLMNNDMDDKGAVLNSAFAVSASFVFADHLAFTLAFEPSFLLPMIVAKLVGGLTAFALALFVYKKFFNNIAPSNIIDRRDSDKSSD